MCWQVPCSVSRLCVEGGVTEHVPQCYLWKEEPVSFVCYSIRSLTQCFPDACSADGIGVGGVHAGVRPGPEEVSGVMCRADPQERGHRCFDQRTGSQSAFPDCLPIPPPSPRTLHCRTEHTEWSEGSQYFSWSLVGYHKQALKSRV